ncbi:MAG: isoprenylcysteine carboxylmethyltransferase family protein [Acidobacteriia bacterium]|nr:isoprenylcysteine carboxylmethyltransferase family protein [Terriglobia bacterium]
MGLFLFAVWHCHGKARLSAVLIGCPAFVLWLMAKLNLGESFTLSAQAQHLVTHGLYSRIRHPIYFFSTLALFAIALCLHSLLLYIYVALVVGVQLWRARVEERVLAERFGEAYREYRRRTWF